MAVDYPYTTEERIVAKLGQLGVGLRLDDSPDPASDLEDAIDAATAEVDFYLAPRYSQSDAADNEWVQQKATWFAIRELCLRRNNEVPESVAKEIERATKQLEAVLARKATVPRLAHSRRPGVVTGYTTDMRRLNNQVRVDKARSTGVAEDYRRPTDPTAPDGR